jgi:hypothetical protein
LPDINANTANVSEAVDVLVFVVFGVGDFWMNPDTLVGRIGDFLGLPFTFVFWVGNQRSFPGAVSLIIPIFGFLGFRIRNLFGDIIPTGWFLVSGVINGGFINPIRWFTLGWVFDGLWWEEVPIFK